MVAEKIWKILECFCFMVEDSQSTDTPCSFFSLLATNLVSPPVFSRDPNRVKGLLFVENRRFGRFCSLLFIPSFPVGFFFFPFLFGVKKINKTEELVREICLISMFSDSVSFVD